MAEGEERRRWQRVQDLFHRARELEPARRGPFLHEQCAGDERLHAEVAGLLEFELSDAEGSAPVPARAAGAREDLSGRELGSYRLERIIGAGSMGVIYAARQRYVERSVALKILRRRGDVLAGGAPAEAYERMTQRFLAEAEVLGLLDHPGIVPIHALERDGERSYFTMRLVRGDDFRDLIARVHAGAPGWSLHRALGVVLRVCETMAFAHARGVLHRDLKPSHVMVGAFGEVYIVDWGLAKLPGRPEARDLRLCEDVPDGSPTDTRAPTPLCTVEGDVIGTPAYMPPEQARGELGKLGVRSDVYALGALLYHLLVGRAPYLAEGQSPSARVVLARVVDGPPAPVRSLAPAVPPALAAIAEKAMRRAPEERYAGMEELAADLRAFLENRVVGAHRTGALVELTKWLQRNRKLAGALALALASLAGWGASVLAIQAGKARALAQAVDETARERDRAREQAAIASATTGFLDDMFRSLHPLEARGETVTVRDALDRASARLDGAFAELPLVEAALRTTLGVAYRRLGHMAEAEPHLARAHALRRGLLAEGDPALLESMQEYGALLGDLARFDEGEALLRRALELRRASSVETPEALRAAGLLAQLLLDRGSLAEAEALALGLVAALERAGSEGEELLAALEVLGSIHYRRDELVEAEARFRRQLELDRRLFGDEHPNTLIATTNVVTVLDALGRHDEALELGLLLVERMTRVFGPGHANTLAAAETSAILLCNRGRAAEGVALQQATLARVRAAFGDGHPRTLLSLYNLAELLRRSKRFAEARPLYEELLAAQRARLGEDDPDLRRCLLGLSDCLLDAGELEPAVEVLRELLPLQRRNRGAPLSDAGATALELLDCYAKLGWEEERRALLAETTAPAPAAR